MHHVLFLNYHSIDIGVKSEIYHVDPVYSVRQEAFEAQMKLIRELHIPVLSLPQYLQAVKLKQPFAQNSLVITFDDGFLTDYEIAYPILKSYGFPATFFVCLVNIKSQYRWRQMREMTQDDYTIGSHTISHAYLSDLSPADLVRELSQSKNIIEEKTGSPVKFLAPPGGRYNANVIETAANLGYEALLTTRVGLNHSGSDVMQLNRWTVRYHTTLTEFGKMITQDRSILRSKILKSQALNLSKKIIGNSAFDKLRELLLPPHS
jgi:peptidoglycan/xylan/chitin deacetylase (PgdA/CDA1 family)